MAQQLQVAVFGSSPRRVAAGQAGLRWTAGAAGEAGEAGEAGARRGWLARPTSEWFDGLSPAEQMELPAGKSTRDGPEANEPHAPRANRSVGR
jgi:hypothetical protein